MKRLRISAALLALALPLVGVLTSAADARPSTASATTESYTVGRTFYVSPSGSDSASGLSPAQPWRTLDRASQATLRPGDHLLLQGGSTFRGSRGLTISASGTTDHRILVSHYGTGRATISGAPGDCVNVTGNNVSVRWLAVDHCTWAGVHVRGDYDIVRMVEASWSWAGVQVEVGASYTSVLDDLIHDNVRMTPNTPGPDDDSGAFGVLVNGDHTRISRNAIWRQNAPSADYGRDGSAVEVFGGQYVMINNNHGTGNQTFTEIGGQNGGAASYALTVRGNLVSTPAERNFFVVLHAGDNFGAARDVSVTYNRVTLSGPNSVGVVCGPKCTSSALTMSSNTINAAGGSMYVAGTYGRG